MTGGSFTDFGELVLIIGDFNTPYKQGDISPVFKELLNTDKIKTVLCTGNSDSDFLQSIAPNVHIVRGEFDSLGEESLCVTIGHFRVGLIHGHQIVPHGDHSAMEAFQRKLNVDILVSGHTHTNEIYQNVVGKYFINPGSATGSDTSPPSFMLMAVQGPSAAIYVYELIDGKANVVMSEIKK